MILGIGTDLVDIRRIEKAYARHGERFLKRCFTIEEITKAQTRLKKEPMARTLAKCFAAKEACAKALGIGFRHGITLKDIAVENDALGKPALILKRQALKRFQDMKGAHIHVSLSDEPPLAIAYVIVEGTGL